MHIYLHDAGIQMKKLYKVVIALPFASPIPWHTMFGFRFTCLHVFVTPEEIPQTCKVIIVLETQI